MKYWKTYEESCMDYRLSKSHVFQYFHNLFDGGSKRLYRDKVAPIFSYRRAKSFLIQSYKSISRQNRFRQYSKVVSLQGIGEEESCDISETLEKRRDTIKRSASQEPTSFRTAEAKIEHLSNAVA